MPMALIFIHLYIYIYVWHIRFSHRYSLNQLLFGSSDIDSSMLIWTWTFRCNRWQLHRSGRIWFLQKILAPVNRQQNKQISPCDWYLSNRNARKVQTLVDEPSRKILLVKRVSFYQRIRIKNTHRWKHHVDKYLEYVCAPDIIHG